MEKGLTKQEIISTLTRSPHGELKAYVPIAVPALHQDPEFMAHLIAWNDKRGAIRDSKVALPVIATGLANDYRENALAHMCLLSPRDLLRAVRFGKDIGGRPVRVTERVVERYLRAREANPGWFYRTALTHRDSMKSLYGMLHIKPADYVDMALLKGKPPAGSVLAVVRDLRGMSARDAAVAIAKHRIPFLVAASAMGDKAKDTDFVLALIDTMTPAELVTNTKMLERLGIKTVPALRAAYEQGLVRVAESKKATATLKTTKAAEQVTDAGLKAKLQAAQEKQLASVAVDGDWLVLGDKSGSMALAIDAARHVAATLAKMVKGKVHLVFFDTMPRGLDCTGMTYEQIASTTKGVMASGGTNIGIGIDWALHNKIAVDGIAIVSDGGDYSNCAAYYERYCKWLDKSPPVYFYKVKGSDADRLSALMKPHDMQLFDLTAGVDYYSLPNVVQTMRANRYSLTDEIMAAPLLTLDEVFAVKEATA